MHSIAQTLRTLDSPIDTDKFSTPPSTPSVWDTAYSSDTVTDEHPPPQFRRTSLKPHAISIDRTLPIDLQGATIEQDSSPNPRNKDSSTMPHNAISPLRPGYTLTQDPQSRPHLRVQPPPAALRSPCFVHSLLDKGASFSNWLENNSGYQLNSQRKDSPIDPEALITAKITDMTMTSSQFIASSPQTHHSYSSDDEESLNSLTKQLADTAVGVRELSKQLGRARVRSNIQSVLIVTKARDNRLIKLTRELAVYLMLKKAGDERGLTVYVDNQLRRSKRFDAEGIERDHPEFFVPSPRRRSSSSHSLASMTSDSPTNGAAYRDDGQLRYWTSEMCSRDAHLFDFVVTLGGDGTVLFTSWLFQRIVPPVLPFALGSLGFLTNFDFAEYAGVMDAAIDNGIRVNLRMRFTCTVYRAVAPEKGKGSKAVKKAETGEILMKNLDKGGWEALEGGGAVPTGSCTKDKEIMCFTTRPVESFEILNDLVVDRGPSPYVSLLELFGDEHHMTTVQADGLTVSTPTGSTAYSLSAGGSLVHPEIPALLITPICPHTLSFRPMLLPDSMELRICVPYNSRSTAWASFDGRGRVELKQGDHIKVTASKFPFPTVCADKQSTDWFHAISRTLKWNERERQKSFVVVEEGPARSKGNKSPSTTGNGRSAQSVNPIPEEEAIGDGELDGSDEEDEEDEEEEEEEEKFDIDDSSPEATAKSNGNTEPSSPPPSTARTHGYDGVGKLRLASSSSAGIETPDRFANGRHPHPPTTVPRHLISDAAEKIHILHGSPPIQVHDAMKSKSRERGEDGTRDDIHSPRDDSNSRRSRIPQDRDVEAESMLTPRADAEREAHSPRHQQQQHYHHQRHHSSPLQSGAPRRAFAAWGLDDSDSNASDND